MAGRVDQVEDVVLAVVGVVVEAHGLRLDGDAALALDVHVVEHLLASSRARPARRSIWISRSASVDLPWSIWATIEKLRMWDSGCHARGFSRGRQKGKVAGLGRREPWEVFNSRPFAAKAFSNTPAIWNGNP